MTNHFALQIHSGSIKASWNFPVILTERNSGKNPSDWQEILLEHISRILLRSEQGAGEGAVRQVRGGHGDV